MDPLEEYQSPFDFEQGVNSSYLYLYPADSDTPPSSPAVKTRGTIPEVGEDALMTAGRIVSATSWTQEEREERTELQGELEKVEDEIQTLSQVLAAKEKQLAGIKRKLGITPLDELRQNITKGWQEATTSTAYKRTSVTLNQASQKATEAFSILGSVLSRKFEDVRNTPHMKTIEDKVETFKVKMTAAVSGSDDGKQGASSSISNPPPGKPEDKPKQEVTKD